MSRVRGSVLTQVGRIEIWARYSVNSFKNGSVVSSLEDLTDNERPSVTDREWNWKILRDQFFQKDLEILYRKYDDKLRLSYLSMFLILQILVSLTHLLVLGILIGVNNINELIPILCYSTQTILILPIVGLLYFQKLTKKYGWISYVCSILVLVVLLITDILVPILSDIVPPLRAAYYTHTLLVCYVFLPVLNNYIALLLGTLVSLAYLIVNGLVTYKYDEIRFEKLGGDILYLIGVNYIGIYYRLMNEVVTRRSFLDRRGCIEATLKLNFEKEQEERLLLSILPSHVASMLRHDLRSVFLKIRANDRAPSTTFNQLYIKEHQNVSILYADVVNYTMITTTLEPRDLVETLNELFGRFDEASEEHEVLRIKFLGDCYYCVSGVPDPNPQHAKNCVDLGLKMISIIKDVREKRRLNIDMRIGIHSGDVISGLVGIRKWQYDIWSKDVTIANKMESTGKPGKVHITNKTLDELGDFARDYIVEPNFEASKDPLLAKHKLETFILTKPPKERSGNRVSFRRVSVGFSRPRIKSNQKDFKLKMGESGVKRRTTAFMDNNLIAYRQMLKAANMQMAKVIEQMPSGIFKEYTKEENINPWTLLYRNSAWEVSFLKQPDPLFKYFIVSSFFVLILMMGVQVLTIEVIEWSTLVTDAVLILALIILQPLTWTQFAWNKWKGVSPPTNSFIKFFYDVSRKIVWSATARIILYFLVCGMLATSAIVNLTTCEAVTRKVDLDENCIASWHMAHMCALVLLLSFLFSRVFFIFKWTVGFALTSIYMWLVWDFRSEVFSNGSTWNAGLDSKIAHTMAIGFLTFALFWTDRQTEYRNRLDHRWKKQLTEEQEEAITMKFVNNMLLQNILPAHVADIYLNTNRSSEELYHEEYTHVAVIFASLTDYRLGVEEDADVPERVMLWLLDQLISDFDKLLLDSNKRLKVEKIKMAGWTYMAACGLDPAKRDSLTSSSSLQHDAARANQEYEEEVVRTMLEFAGDMMKQLRSFNRGSFQNFQGTNLKIGIAHGQVTAGVVGSLKPLYDIWGNAVNMASRMDSTGIAGRIQVTESTAIVLDRQGILTQFRGKIFVKGAGYVRTYFVPLDDDFNLIMKDKVTYYNPVERVDDDDDDEEITKL